jgi:tRNA(Ile2) C34 agmatinyltransferase TiaS
MTKEREHEPICPECGSPDLRSLGYNYDLAKVFYECSDCEAQGDSEYFDPDDMDQALEPPLPSTIWIKTKP